MSINRRAAKRDSNERDIVNALIGVGASVTRLSAKGVPDALVGYRGITHLAEIKSQRGKLTLDQIEWQANWYGGDVVILRNVDEAIEWVRGL